MRPALLLLAATLLVPAALAQSAEDVLREAMDRYAAEMDGVRDYTVTQAFMGREVTTYAERADGAGPLAFTYHLVTANGLVDMSEMDSDPTPPDPYLMLDRIADEASYAGTEDVGGTRAHVIAVDDFGEIAREFGAVPEDAADEFDIQTATFYIGTDDYRIHRMTMAGTMTNDGETSPVRFDTQLTDYRTVDGLTLPHRTKMRMEGMESQMSDAEREEARQQLEQLRAQMAQMSEDQRRMMEGMMGDQLENLEQMLGGGGFEMEMEVTDVKVNTGRPE